jgi:secondary thiamine-phosphate synthase enzyme
MKQLLKTLELKTNKQFQLLNVTDQVKQAITESGVQSGIATVFTPHTTASVRCNHDEPLLAQDIMKAVYRLVPLDISYSHDLFEVRENVSVNERSNGQAHVKSFLFGSSETFVIENGQPMLGERQSIFFVEFDGGRPRKMHVKIMGE